MISPWVIRLGQLFKTLRANLFVYEVLCALRSSCSSFSCVLHVPIPHTWSIREDLTITRGLAHIIKASVG